MQHFNHEKCGIFYTTAADVWSKFNYTRATPLFFGRGLVFGYALTSKQITPLMHKLRSTCHGIIDYVVVLFLFMAPSVFHLPHKTMLFTYGLGVIHLVLTISTNFEVGLLKMISFKVHGNIELVVSLALVGVGFYLGSMEGQGSQNFYFFFAAALFIVWLITDYNSVESGRKTY